MPSSYVVSLTTLKRLCKTNVYKGINDAFTLSLVRVPGS